MYYFYKTNSFFIVIIWVIAKLFLSISSKQNKKRPGVPTNRHYGAGAQEGNFQVGSFYMLFFKKGSFCTDLFPNTFYMAQTGSPCCFFVL